MPNFKKAVEEAAKTNSSSAYSKSAYDALSNELLNDPDFELTSVTRSAKDPNGYEITSSKPVADFRAGLAKTAKEEFGIDTAEAEKLKTCTFNKQTCSAFATLSGVAVKGYMETGKTFQLPLTNVNEARSGFFMKEIPEKVEDTMKMVESAPGKWERVPTGKTIKTKKHNEVRVKNSAAYSWIKNEV